MVMSIANKFFFVKVSPPRVLNIFALKVILLVFVIKMHMQSTHTHQRDIYVSQKMYLKYRM